ncbi:MAG: bifunctional folylpolyglutamate synthase/dihydrofolate synthase [Nitrospiraceae bacterium]|nr:bifunctional folylpolyglutamate synthase/dihydrofolate synthase [Nitrospiraceae bacterium]
MKYNEAVGYLYGLQKHGIKLGLDNPRRLLAAIGNPQKSFSSIHIAGTNGKGSTSTAIASILRANGFRTGLFTSPHLVSFTERIRIDGREVEEETIVELTGRLIETVRNLPGLSPTFFEFATAMAFLYFRENAVQWAAVETGMGGRLDATNTVEPRVAVITPVSMDHREFLGGTLREIAGEKAGIIKPGVPLVLGPQMPEALAVMEETAQKNSCPVYIYGRDFYSTLREQTATGITFDYESPGLELKDIFFPLRGYYQAVNAATAIKAIELAGSADADLIRKGLGEAILPGRLELASANPDIVLDGAHNPEAARTLARAIREIYPGRNIVLVAGIMSDKDIDGILKELLPVARKTIFTAPAYARAARPEELSERAGGLGFTGGLLCPEVSGAIEKARGLAEAGDIILIAGSFYTAGEAKEAILRRSGTSFSRLRE